MKSLKKLVIPALIGLLVGCGSDSSDNSAPDPEPSPDLPQKANDYDNINVTLRPDQQLGGPINVRIGKWFPCLPAYPSFCSEDGRNKETEFDYQSYTVESSDLARVLGKSIRPDIMAEGQFSLLDMALYLGKTRDDLEVTLGEFNEELDTYEFTVSYDYNRDGQFSEEDGEEYYQSPHWWPASHYSNGEFARDVNDAPMEAYYNRADTVPLQVDQYLRLRPFTRVMTERRQTFQRSEVDRRKSLGKTVIPTVKADFGDGRGYITIAENIEVRSFDLRPDIYQPGVLTIADVLMTMYEDQDIDVGLTWWPVNTNDAPIHSYALSRIHGQEASGFKGWLMKTDYGQTAQTVANSYNSPTFSDPDYNAAMFYMSIEEIMGAPAGTFCPWLGELDEEEARGCQSDFAHVFGGSFVHILPDNWVITNPPESIMFTWNDQNMLWQAPEFAKDDGQLPWYDIGEADELLDESHFGWGYADCAVCHTQDNTHLKGDSPALEDVTRPYYCASCHGSNGAPMGHGEDARCHWCHARDKAPKHHGSASIEVDAEEIECWHDATVSAPCANDPSLNMKPHDRADAFLLYPEQMTFPVNSDWSQSKDFPDPYSCLTCHPNTDI